MITASPTHSTAPTVELKAGLAVVAREASGVEHLQAEGRRGREADSGATSGASKGAEGGEAGGAAGRHDIFQQFRRKEG